MRNKTIVGTILVVFIISGSIFAQEKEQKIELPQLTLEQKWDRAIYNLTSFWIAGIAYAKSQGKTAADFGKYVGELFAPEWEGAKGKGVQRFIQGMCWNWQIFKDFKMEILSESKTSFEAKIKGFAEGAVKAWTEPGVTIEDYFRCYEQLMVAITDYLGLEYKQKVEGDWIYFTVTEKK